MMDTNAECMSYIYGVKDGEQGSFFLCVEDSVKLEEILL